MGPAVNAPEEAPAAPETVPPRATPEEMCLRIIEAANGVPLTDDQRTTLLLQIRTALQPRFPNGRAYTCARCGATVLAVRGPERWVMVEAESMPDKHARRLAADHIIHDQRRCDVAVQIAQTRAAAPGATPSPEAVRDSAEAARGAHNLEVAGSSPAPATNDNQITEEVQE